MPISDLTLYRNKAYLELCLELVESAYNDLQQGNYELAASELRDILETFDMQEVSIAVETAQVIEFPDCCR